MRRRARERQEEREDRPILKRLRATLLRSFRGLHCEKMVFVSEVGNWDPQEEQQPF